jgi:acyl carrier protein
LDDVVEIVSRHLLVDRRAVEADPAADLRDLGLDSMGAIDLLLDLEQAFDVVFPDELLTDETFRSVRSLAAALQTLVDETEGASERREPPA